MVRIGLHYRRMGEDDELSRRITPEFVKRRGAHLKLLEPLEDLVREISPLAISYDVTRAQPPWFQEFTYTEMLGCFYVAPQSSELAARVVQAAYDSDTCVPDAGGGFDAVAAIMARPQMDKYALSATKGPLPERVVFLPGTNLFDSAVSRELLVAAMTRYPDLHIKPHPMTNERTLRTLGRLFDYERVLEPMASGWDYLQAARHVYVTTATEMGLYAVLLGKRVHNISQIKAEARGAYAPFYRLLWDLDPDEARAALVRALNAPAGGFVHPADPDLRAKLTAAFGLAMALRAPFRPLVHEYDPEQYAAMLRGAPNAAPMRTSDDAVRAGGKGTGKPGDEVPAGDGGRPQDPGGVERLRAAE